MASQRMTKKDSLAVAEPPRMRQAPGRRAGPATGRGRRRMVAPAPTLLERLRSVVGKAKGLPPDASINHDHYLYGMPRR